MRQFTRMAIAAGVVVAFMAGQAHAAPPSSSPSSAPQACGEAGSVTLDGKSKLWPPNHKMSSYTVSYSGGVEGETLSTSASHDEFDADGNELKGTGKRTNVDVDPASASDSVGAADAETGESDVASTSHKLRAERAGGGDGRTYTINFTVSGADASEVCSGSFSVVVPKSRKGGAKAA